MKAVGEILDNGGKNFVLLGESGSGKSEIALNLAEAISLEAERPVKLYDLDMTKPLFRSRDLKAKMQPKGVEICYQEQFMDSPAVAGGIRAGLKAKNNITLIDVGGNQTGAKMIGAYSSEINKENTTVYYVINIYRPWSKNLEVIDITLSEILGATHIKPEKIKFIANPNFGRETTYSEFINGIELTKQIIPAELKIEFYCAQKSIYRQLTTEQRESVFPLELYLAHF